MAHLLNYLHWWVWLGLIAIGAVVFISANRRSDAMVRSAGLLLIGLGVVLGTVRLLIDTDQERMERRTRALVAAANTHDWPKLQSILDPDTSLDIPLQAPVTSAHGAVEITKEAEKGADVIELHSVGIVSLHSEQTDSLITVTASVVSTDGMDLDRSELSDWQFIWQQRGDDFFLETIRLTSVGNQQLSH